MKSSDPSSASHQLNSAWDAVFDVLPAGWRVGPPSFDPDPSHLSWSVSANKPSGRRGVAAQTVTGTGATPEAALVALAGRLTGATDPEAGTRLDELRKRLRLAYVEGAQSEWPGMTGDALAGVLRRFLGAS